MAPAAAAVPPQIPKAIPRLRPRNVEETMDSVEGETVAAPTAWTKRPTSTQSIEGAAPTRSEPATKMPKPEVEHAGADHRCRQASRT